MTSAADEKHQRIVKFGQELLLDEEDRSVITPALISEKIDLVLAMNPKWGEGLERQAVTDELVRRNRLWIGADALLRSDVGHEPWLVASRKHDWGFWQRYRECRERRFYYRAVYALVRVTQSLLFPLRHAQT